MSASYDYYKIFYYVAKCHSFNKAAAALFNSQPNITRAINNLETELGCKLFNRSHTGVTLTDEGISLFQYVDAAYKQISLGEAVLNSRKALAHGNVTLGLSIGITQSLQTKMILPSITSFHQSFPSIHMRIVNDSSPHLISDVSEGLIDLAVITAIPHGKKKITEIPLYSFQDIAIVGHAYQKQLAGEVSLHQLIEYPLIGLWHETETYEVYKNFYAKYDLEYEPRIETATTSQILSFAASNMGYGFISPEYAEHALRDGTIIQIQIAEPLPVRSIVLIHNNNMTINPAASQLKNFITGSISP